METKYISQLLTSFSSNCWIPFSKALIPYLKTLDKVIPDFQLYFNGKKFNSTKKLNLSDKERYDQLIDQIIFLVNTNDQFKQYSTNYVKFIEELGYTLKSDNVYSLLSTNFTKGSYGKMVDRKSVV